MKAITILSHSLLGSMILIITIVRILTGTAPSAGQKEATTRNITGPVVG